MGGTAFPRGRAVEALAPRKTDTPRRLPPGYGLSIAAGASLGLWAGIVWLAARLIG